MWTMQRAMWIALTMAVLAVGCRRKPTPELSSERRSDAGPVKYQPSGRRPVNPTRETPPPAVASALDKGASAPAVELATISGGSRSNVHLADVLAKERALLVFYRGDW